MAVHIAYVVDHNFADGAIVSATSAVKNNKDINIHFHFIFPNQSLDKISQIENELKEMDAEVSLYPFKLEEVNSFNLSGEKRIRSDKNKISFTKTVFGKLLLPNLLKIEKVIFMDSDTLVGNCLKELESIEIGNNIIGAVIDGSERKILKDTILKEYKLKNYYNTGLMIMDLVKLREFNFIEQCLRCEEEISQTKPFADQDLINITLRENIFRLEEKFNIQVWYNIPKKEFAESIHKFENGIIHFVGPVKPWQDWCRPLAKELWGKYAKSVKKYQITRLKIEKFQQYFLYSENLDADELYKDASVLKSTLIRKLMDQIVKNK